MTNSNKAKQPEDAVAKRKTDDFSDEELKINPILQIPAFRCINLLYKLILLPSFIQKSRVSYRKI